MIRLVIGPTTGDRILALDTMVIDAIGMIVLVGLAQGTQIYFEAALIFAMLAIGAALEASGAVQLIVEAIAPYLALLPGPLLIWAIFLLTSVLTEAVSNNAVAVVVTPIAVALGQETGVR